MRLPTQELIPACRLREPDSARRLVGEGGKHYLFDAETPKFAGDDGGVGHALAGLDAGNECDGTRVVWDVTEGALGHSLGESASGYALAGADAGQLGEELGAVDVFLVYG